MKKFLDKILWKITLNGNMGVAALLVIIFQTLLVLVGGPIAIYGVYKIGRALGQW